MQMSVLYRFATSFLGKNVAHETLMYHAKNLEISKIA